MALPEWTQTHSLKEFMEMLDPIQDKCVHGYVLPDRCRYTRHLGCDCGAYPPDPFPAYAAKMDPD